MLLALFERYLWQRGKAGLVQLYAYIVRLAHGVSYRRTEHKENKAYYQPHYRALYERFYGAEAVIRHGRLHRIRQKIHCGAAYNVIRNLRINLYHRLKYRLRIARAAACNTHGEKVCVVHSLGRYGAVYNAHTKLFFKLGIHKVGLDKVWERFAQLLRRGLIIIAVSAALLRVAGCGYLNGERNFACVHGRIAEIPFGEP